MGQREFVEPYGVKETRRRGGGKIHQHTSDCAIGSRESHGAPIVSQCSLFLPRCVLVAPDHLSLSALVVVNGQKFAAPLSKGDGRARWSRCG